MGDPTFFISDETQEMHRVQSIRNQCLTLISSLIEVFGDIAVHAVLLVVHNLFHEKHRDESTSQETNPWMEKFSTLNAAAANLGGLALNNDRDSEDIEESKEPLQEDMEPEEARMRKEAKEFKALLSELVYISKHAKNGWKRREGAILLIGTFIKDVSAFLIRNPFYDLLQNLFDQVVATEFAAAPGPLRTLLIGRALQCATLIIDCDIVPRGDQGDAFKQSVMVSAFESLCSAKETSV